MQIFVPYASPLETAKILDPKRLNKQIIECRQILDAINGTGKGWFNHPVVKMYAPYKEWLELYMKCLKAYKGEVYAWCSLFDIDAQRITPPFLTEEFCIQHRRRLYTKDKEYYKQFAEYGESEENWYCIGWKIVKYINGKIVK